MSEVGKLLTMISMFDNRTIDEEGTQAEVWFLLDFIKATDYDLAAEAVALFFSQPAPANGQMPYLDPRWLRTYIGRARQARQTRAAQQSARRGLTRGPADPRPADFRERVHEAARQAGAARQRDPEAETNGKVLYGTADYGQMP